MKMFSEMNPIVCLDFIKTWEGCRLEAYHCSADKPGLLTIGYGHTGGVRPGQKITQAQADKLLSDDVTRMFCGIKNFVRVPVTDGMFIAIMSLTFNCGLYAIKTSTLLRELNRGNYEHAANEFTRWIYSAGKISQGLLMRRNHERETFLSEGIPVIED